MGQMTGQMTGQMSGQMSDQMTGQMTGQMTTPYAANAAITVGGISAAAAGDEGAGADP